MIDMIYERLQRFSSPVDIWPILRSQASFVQYKILDKEISIGVQYELQEQFYHCSVDLIEMRQFQTIR